MLFSPYSSCLEYTKFNPTHIPSGVQLQGSQVVLWYVYVVLLWLQGNQLIIVGCCINRQQSLGENGKTARVRHWCVACGKLVSVSSTKAQKVIFYNQSQA